MRGRPHRAAACAFAFACLAAVSTVAAQDSFGEAPRSSSSTRPQATEAAPPARRDTRVELPRASRASGEGQDYGVAPQADLRPSDALHAPTPTAIPGGRVIDTRALAALLRDPQAKALLFHVYGAPEHLPGAIQATPAGQGGGFDDAVQKEFGAFLKQQTAGSAARPLVFYCQGTQCWMSYNAALRAIRMGYRNVFWYRGGLEAWSLAGLPTQGGTQDRGASR